MKKLIVLVLGLVFCGSPLWAKPDGTYQITVTGTNYSTLGLHAKKPRDPFR